LLADPAPVANAALGTTVNSCRGESTVKPEALEHPRPESVRTSISMNPRCPVNAAPKSKIVTKRPLVTATSSAHNVEPLCKPTVAVSYRRNRMSYSPLAGAPSPQSSP